MRKFYIGFDAEGLTVVTDQGTPQEKRFYDSIDGLNDAAGVIEQTLKHLFPDAEIEVVEEC